MYVDVVKYTGVAATQISSVLYVTLQSGTDDLTEHQYAEAAPFGGATGSHKRFRERFAIQYERSSQTIYTWSNVEFVKATDLAWIARLQQDQQLDYPWWYQGGNGAATFGSSGGSQFDLTTSSNLYLKGYLTSLCSIKDVNRLALSHLQGRLRFSEEEQATDEISNQVMSADDLWQRVYAVSAWMSGRLGQVYALPLRLGQDVDRRQVAEYAAKEVLVQVMTALQMVGGNRGLTELVTTWRDEVRAFLESPVGLEGEDRRMSGGTFRLERA